MTSTLKVMLKRAVPQRLLNQALLTFPALYHSKLVNYETNMGRSGLEDLISQLGQAINLPGDIVECGSSRCGASVIMANYCRRRGVKKKIYACDSFQGFDKQELMKERAAGLTSTPMTAFTSTSYDYVRQKMSRLGLEEIVRPVKGYFAETLPQMNVPVCFVLIDCDLADSIAYCAEEMWPHLTSQGRMLFDDYQEDEFRGARLGVDQFVQRYTAQIECHGMLQQLYVIKKR
jgi:hypothetical protein